MSTSNDWWNRVYQKVASNVFGNEDPRQQQQNPQFFDLLCHPFGCSRSPVSTSTATVTVNQRVTSKPFQVEVPVPPRELLETVHQPWSLESIPVNQSLYPEFQKEFISLLSQGLAVHALIIPQTRQEQLQTKAKTLGITHHPHAPTKIGFLSKETKECNRLSRKYSMALTDVISLTSSPKLDWDKEDFRKRLIQVQSVSGISLLFAMPTVSEAQVVLCGLKTLLEQESVRWGRRGGARIDYSVHSKYFLDHNSVDDDDDDDTIPTTSTSHPSSNASSNNNSHNSNDKYDGGQLLLLEDLVTNCNIPLPLPLCRALMLDSESPVMTAWSTDNLATSWTFPTNHHHSPNNNYGTTPPPSTDAAVLVAFKNMVGATRNWMHKHNPSEKDTPTLMMIIDEDDDDKLACTISEHAPRNGFSIQIHILFRKMNNHCCEASIMAELRPIIPTNNNNNNNNNNNKQTQYPSFLLQDLTKRYGTHDKGLLGTFIHVVDTFPVRSSTNHNYYKRNNEETYYQQETKAKTNRNNNNHVINMIPTKTTTVKKKNADNQLASSFNQVLTVSKSFDYENESNQDFHNCDHDNNNNTLVKNTNHQKNGIPTDIKNNTTQNPYTIENHSNFPRTKPGSPETKRKSLNDTKHQNYPERPATPSLRTKMDHEETRPSRRNQLQIRNDDAFQELQFNNNNFHPPGPKRTIAVKPLPKIRLDLMPAPREEDEDNCSSASLPETKAPKTTKKKKSYSMRKNDTKKKTDDKRKRRSKRHVP